MRLLVGCLLCLYVSSADAACSTATPPAIASAVGLTNLVLCDDFTDTSTIDVNDTRNPATCVNATFPSKQCHWYVHRAWPDSTLASGAGGVCNSPGWALTAGKCITNLPAVQPADWSVDGSGLHFTPRVAQVTANNTSGTNSITGISVVSGTLPTGAGIIGVLGTGVPANTTATISGTTATLSANTTSGSTGGTYYFIAVYNGWMFETAASSTSDPGYVGFAPVPPFYIEATLTYASAGNAQWTINESYPEFWSWPLELLTAAHSGTVSSNRDFCELDAKEATFGQTLHSQTINGDGNLYWQNNQLAGHTNYLANFNDGDAFGTATFGVLITRPVNGSGGSANTGEITFTKNGVSQSRILYGCCNVPTLNGSNTTGFNPAGPLPAGFYDPTGGHYCGGNHYPFHMGGAGNWPMTVTAFRLWGLPQAIPSRTRKAQ